MQIRWDLINGVKTVLLSTITKSVYFRDIISEFLHTKSPPNPLPKLILLT